MDDHSENYLRLFIGVVFFCLSITIIAVAAAKGQGSSHIIFFPHPANAS